jgi:hypothetical protein
MIHEVEANWLPRWGGRPWGWVPAPITVTGGSHLPEFGFLNLLDYTFSICGLFSLCKPDMWAIFDYFQLAPCRNRYSPKLMEFYQLNT